MYGTPYADDELRIDGQTQPEEVREFVERRIENPIRIGGVTVYNLSTHEPDMQALEAKVGALKRSHYIIPYQISAVWGYMLRLLPGPLRDIEILEYSRQEGVYKAFKNFRRASDKQKDRVLRSCLEKEIENERGDLA